MKHFLKFILVGALLLGLLGLIVALLVMFNVVGHPNFSISVNGAELPLDELHAGHFALGVFGLGVAAVVVMVVVPLALLLGLAMPLLMLGLGLSLGVMALLGIGALALSPLLLIVLVLIWLARRKAPRPPT